MTKGETKSGDVPDERDPTTPGESRPGDDAHTELRRPAKGPRPRSHVLPKDLDDEPGEDDPFNDMPV